MNEPQDSQFQPPISNTPNERCAAADDFRTLRLVRILLAWTTSTACVKLYSWQLAANSSVLVAPTTHDLHDAPPHIYVNTCQYMSILDLLILG